MNVMAGTTTPTLHTVDFFYGKNPNNELDSLFVLNQKKKIQNPSGSTASQRIFAIRTKSQVGRARMTAKNA